MRLLAVNGTSLLYLGIVLVSLYVALLLVALAYNVVRDARRRSASIPFAVFAFLLAFIPPFLGALIYLVVRPPGPWTRSARWRWSSRSWRSRRPMLRRPVPAPPAGGTSRRSSSSARTAARSSLGDAPSASGGSGSAGPSVPTARPRWAPTPCPPPIPGPPPRTERGSDARAPGR